MKLLIYAFEPFGRNKHNISQQVLKRLRKRENIKKTTFPVEFKSSVFINAVQKAKPDAILGLGQYPRGKKIRIERRAQNQKKSKAQPPASITKHGRSIAVVTLRLRSNNDSWISYNAGRYVCNLSIYVLLTSSVTKDIPLAFLHIPKNVGVGRAAKFVEDRIDEILTK